MTLKTASLTQFADDLFAAWNRRDVDHAATFYHPDYVGEDVGSGTVQRSPQDVREWLAMYWSTFPDLHFTISEAPVEMGDRVAFQYLATGTHQGPLMGLAPTQRSVSFRGMTILTVHEGQVLRATYFWDALGVLRQLGAIG